MSCSFLSLAACFTLNGVYIDGALIHSNIGEARIDTATTEVLGEVWADDKQGGRYVPALIQYKKPFVTREEHNPYARVSIGYDVQWSPKWSTRLDYSHESSIATGRDRGQERFTLGVTWRPFAR